MFQTVQIFHSYGFQSCSFSLFTFLHSCVSYRSSVLHSFIPKRPWSRFFSFSSIKGTTDGARAVLTTYLARQFYKYLYFFSLSSFSQRLWPRTAPPMGGAPLPSGFTPSPGGWCAPAQRLQTALNDSWSLSFYPVWPQTAPNSFWSRWRSHAK
jgi:hypothetical protein